MRQATIVKLSGRKPDICEGRPSPIPDYGRRNPGGWAGALVIYNGQRRPSRQSLATVIAVFGWVAPALMINSHYHERTREKLLGAVDYVANRQGGPLRRE
jgi:hypothetical protein